PRHLHSFPTRRSSDLTDGTSVYFSSTNGLERTNPAFVREAVNSSAIPADLRAMGSTHIGDIDAWNDSLYVPIEDGPDYNNPKVRSEEHTSELQSLAYL